MQRREYRWGRQEIVLLPILLVYGWIFGYLVWDLVVGVTVYVTLFVFVTPIVRWKLEPALAEERTITLSDAGISIEGKTTSRHVEWADYKRTKERNEYYALQRTARRPTTIILKRFFEESGQEAELRALLAAHTNAHLRGVSDAGL